MSTDTPSSSATRMMRLAVAGVSVMLIYLALAWSSVVQQLESIALSEIIAYRDAGNALRWSFADRHSVVLPGSSGLLAATFDPRSGLSWYLENGEADVSLRLTRPALAIQAVERASLSLKADAPLSIRLFATSENGDARAGPVTEHSGGGENALLLALPSLVAGQPAHALRLHLNGPPGTRVELRRLDLHPRDATRLDVCEASWTLPATLAHCGIGPRVVHLPRFVLPERLLGFRDALLTTSLATPYPHGTLRFQGDWMLLARLPSLQAGVRLLVLTVGLIWLVARIQRRRLETKRVSSGPLLLLAAPVLLLWLGIPGEDDNSGLKTFAYCLGLLLLLARSTPPWHWLGDRIAWKEALRVSCVGLIVVAVMASINALDGDRFGGRFPDLDKFWIYPAWALVQQFLLIEVIGPRTRAAAGSDAAASLFAGALFGLLHLPNFSLMVFTFLAGTAWAWLGYRHRALLPLVVSHAVLGLTLMILAPTWLLRSAEIGGRYLMTP